MSLNESMNEVANRLKDWAGLPKYALERRVDVLLTPFLEDFVCAKLGADKVVLVAPEFPILSGLAELGKPRSPIEFDSKFRANSVNADYLLHAAIAGKPFWVLLEFKTDSGSFDREQVEHYALAREWKMPRLIEHVNFIRSRTDHPKKYDELLKRVTTGRKLDGEILVAYLGPDDLSEKVLKPTTDGRRHVDHFWGLSTFVEPREGIPEKHRELWDLVCTILS